MQRKTKIMCLTERLRKEGRKGGREEGRNGRRNGLRGRINKCKKNKRRD